MTERVSEDTEGRCPRCGQLELTDEVRCSFCGKHQHQVQKIIAGPSVYICNGCVALCQEIVNLEDGVEDAD